MRPTTCVTDPQRSSRTRTRNGGSRPRHSAILLGFRRGAGHGLSARSSSARRDASAATRGRVTSIPYQRMSFAVCIRAKPTELTLPVEH